ncbi:lyso-ornithine lipid acyltransferase [Tranquillimonas rosea]|uniref:Lyso-ornithine lipid acyltransferase n=1 Tax=Tranquillimonas rosea TaxID=641238 RepID=A0A1H9VEK7_9RHOB|nr:lysophospholipid acyltransferase family protein [Tranquillimonas rosea]SES20230.1 lyso-ornithine lipid acyltransferase [Tranquillimonas rosea]
MSRTWNGTEPAPTPPITLAGWVRVVLRGVTLGTVTFGGLALLLTLRLIERPLCGQSRPVTPWLTQGVCRVAFVILGLGFSRQGRPMRQRGAVVANHASWLDIFALNAGDRIYFVSKSEVRGWPGIGWLARATGTIFINRAAREAADQRDLFSRRLAAGHRLLFFPEGTSTDGKRVLPFNSTLFAAFFKDDLNPEPAIQPVTLVYRGPRGGDPRFYGWWGEMEFGDHLLKVLAAPRQGDVTLVYHPPIAASAAGDRKTLARRAEAAVRAGLDRHID